MTTTRLPSSIAVIPTPFVSRRSRDPSGHGSVRVSLNEEGLTMTTTDAVRSEMIAAASSYVDALVSHDSASVRLADDVRRLGNGRVVLEGADALRAIIEREPVAAIDCVRWVVEPPHVAVVYDLEADMTRAQQSETFRSEEHTSEL